MYKSVDSGLCNMNIGLSTIITHNLKKGITTDTPDTPFFIN